MKKADLRREVEKVRDALAALDPGRTSHQAGIAPDPNQIFTPSSHLNALDPARALVIGNRGVGKSFWSAVLVHPTTRNQVAPKYPRLHLTDLEAELGFYEDAGKHEGPAPSRESLQKLLTICETPEHIWRAVLFEALRPKLSSSIPPSLEEIIRWS